jgi:hypothetical protein
MGFHAFSLDPRTILGVGPDASMEQIHEAYRAKSKKHHPDMGGDEWAFRMVARAYEVLKTTAEAPASVPSWEARGADVAGPGRSGEWAWTWDARSRRPDDSAASSQANGAEAPDEPDEADRAASSSSAVQEPRLDASRIRTVGVELVWTRFEKDAPALLSERDADDATLSVCMVIAWPPEELAHRTAEFPAAAETLRTLIDLFEQLHNQEAVVAGRSRIEDGRFVGWLSYPDVLTAQDAIVALRETCRTRGLSIKLQTRDERIPFDWHVEAVQPVMSQAS